MAALDPAQAAAIVIAAVTLAGVAFGRLPFAPLDPAGFALVGAAAALATGVVDLHEAVALIDAKVVVLLFGLLLLNEALATAGAFRALMRWATGRAGRPFTLPYLLALATAANVGSVATVTGSPQNPIVSVQGGIGYVPFLVALGPVALVGLGVVLATIALVHRRDVVGGRLLAAPPEAAPLATAALVSGAGVLLTAGPAGRSILARVDLSLLTLFAGLFVVVGALGHTGVTSLALAALGAGWTNDVAGLAAITASTSNPFSKVPAVLLLAPLVAEAGAGGAGYLVLAMASTLPGNLTLVGSVTNLIVAEGARKLGVTVGFWDYLRVSLPITLLTLALGAAWLAFAVA